MIKLNSLFCLRASYFIDYHLTLCLFSQCQIWCALTLVTEIRNRVVRVQMLSLTGTAKKCVEFAQARDAFVLQDMKLTKQQQASVEAAKRRLQEVDK